MIGINSSRQRIYMFHWINSIFLFYIFSPFKRLFIHNIKHDLSIKTKKIDNGFSDSTLPIPVSTQTALEKTPWYYEMSGTFYKIHHEEYATELQTHPIILIHGFGASSFHWRDNIPALSKTNPVYTMDLLGFGASDKPTDIDYTIELWRNQTVAFVKKVYQSNGGKPVVLIGNSIGGYTATYAAVYPEIRDMISAVVLLNPVGVFKGKELPFSTSWLKWVLQPIVFRWFFHYFQSNIRSTLTTLYPKHPERVDDALVASILKPSQDPAAQEVFCRVLKAQLTEKHPYMEDLLCQMTKPLYLLIGKNDPWLIPNIYDDFLKHCPTAFGKWLDAGHCPHDEIPDEINKLIITFLDQFLFNMPPSGAEMD